MPYIEQILKSLNIPVIVKKGYEADDIIGTLSKKAELEGYQTFMVTPDKDFAQLVSENIFMSIDVLLSKEYLHTLYAISSFES